MNELKQDSPLQILSPAGDLEAAIAAIEAGADAIYIGLPHFNARKRATNINFKELKVLCDYAKKKKVNIFVTLNCLLTTKEIPIALHYAYNAYKLGVAAIIVADIGLLGALKKLLPYIPIHASTQLTIHNRPMLNFLKDLGAIQVNYLRELSISELKPLLSYAHTLGLKNELFVHGAYCIANSGICYFSTHLYNYSGNRGECIQPCRRNYFTNEKNGPRPVMNLKDNCAISHLELLKEIGVDTIKIEGRIKEASYVWAVTTSYANKELNLTTQTFNRGFSDSYLIKEVSSKMFQPNTISQDSHQIGILKSYNPQLKRAIIDIKKDKNLETLITPPSTLLKGTLHFYHNMGVKQEHCATLLIERAIFDSKTNSLICEGPFVGKLKTLLKKGHIVFLQKLPQGYTQAKKNFPTLSTTQIDLPFDENKIPINITLTGKIGAPLKAYATILNYASPYEYNYQAECASTMPLLQAQKIPLNKNILNEHLGRLGTTPFYLESLNCADIAPNSFLPNSQLNQLRVELTNTLLTQIKKSSTFSYFPPKEEKQKIAILSSQIEDEELLNSDELLFLNTTSRSDFSLFSNRVIPWISSYLPNFEFEKLLCATKKNCPLVASNNMAFGYALSKENISWIATPTINITNTSAIKTLLTHTPSIKGLFFSQELSHSQIEQFFLEPNLLTNLKEKNVLTLYRAFGPPPLMSSANCIYQNIYSCIHKKKSMDEDCFSNCVYSTTILGEKGESLSLVKNKDMPSLLFSNNIFADLTIANKIPIDYLLLDFRKLPSFILTKQEKKDIINIFRNKIEDKGNLPKKFNYHYEKKGFNEEIGYFSFESKREGS